MEILDSYIKSAPSPQNAIDIFKGEWASRFPENLTDLQAGQINLFNDIRIHWGLERLGGVKDKNVLELGPLEAGHTYMMEQQGATSIVAIEANTRAYLKCLVVKELLQLKQAQFLCGNFVEYLRDCQSKFDICVASGVLYHMSDPVELLSLIARVTDKIFLWTHYYDRDLLQANPHQIYQKFPDRIQAESHGFQHTLYRYEYFTALDDAGFCGGSQPFSYWMSRSDIFACLEYLGFTEIEINFEQPEHPNGLSLAAIAIRHR